MVLKLRANRRDLMPTVGKFVLGTIYKLIGVVGEFDNLELEDSSVDFVFDFFHHKAIKENIAGYPSQTRWFYILL